RGSGGIAATVGREPKLVGSAQTQSLRFDAQLTPPGRRSISRGLRGPVAGGRWFDYAAPPMRSAAAALLLEVALRAAPAAAAEWQEAGPLEAARADAGAAALDGRIYVAGGWSLGGTSRDFEVLDPAGRGWRKLAPLPEALHHPRLAGAGGRVLAIGGYTNLCR